MQQIKLPLMLALARMLALVLTVTVSSAEANGGEGGYVEFREVGQVAVPYGEPRAMCLVGGRAYVANGLGGLAIIEVGAAKPRVLGNLVTGSIGRDSIGREWIHEYRGLATAVSVSGKFAFVLTQSKGYDISRPKVLRINVSDPAHPAPAGECLMTGSASDVAALDETHVCVLQTPGNPPHDDGPLAVVDFSESGREHIVSIARLPKIPGARPARPASFQPGRIAINHGLAFITGTYGKKGAGSQGALHVISLANLSVPAYVSTCVIGEGAVDVAVNPSGTYAYVVSEGSLAVVDLGDILVPKIASTLAVPGGGATAVTVTAKDGYLSTTRGLLTLDLTDAAKPVMRTVVDLGFSPAALVADAGRVALAHAARGLEIFSLTPGGPGKPMWVALAGQNLRLRGTSAGLVFSTGGGATLYEPSATSPAPKVAATLAFDSAGKADYTPKISAALQRALWAANERGATGETNDPLATTQPASAAAAERGRFVVDNLVYAPVDGMGLRVYDVTDPANPIVTSELSIPVDARWRERLGPCAVYVHDKIAYLATGRDGLRIIDVSDARKPVLLGHFYDTAIRRMAVVDVTVRDHKAYLADLDNGLYIVDVREPLQPALLARYHTANAHSVDLSGNLAIVADGVYGLLAIDVSHSARPKVVGSYHAPNIRFNGAAVVPPVGGLPTICVADSGYLRTMTIMPTAHTPLPEGPMELVAHVNVPMGIPDALRVSADGNTAYLAADEGWNFTAIDLRNPLAMRALSVSATSGFCHGLALHGKYAYVTNNYEACTIFDVTDPAHPALAGAVTGLTRCMSAATDGDVLGLCTHEGIVLADLTDPVHPKIQGKCERIGSEFTLVHYGNTRYLLGCGSKGVTVIDVSNLSNPRRVGLVEATGTVGLAVHGEFAFVSCRDTGRRKGNELLVIRFGASQLEIVGRLANDAPLGRLAVMGNTLYVGGDQLTVVDVADPATPKVVGHLAVAHHEGTYDGDVISDVAAFSRQGHDMLAVADHYWGVRLYDASDRSNLKELSELAVSGGDFTGVQAEAPGRVYVSNNWGGIYIVDTSDPLKPAIAGGTRRILSPGTAHGERANKGSSSGLAAGNLLYWQGNTDYVLRIADVRNPANPRLLSELALPREGRSGDDRRFGSAYPQLRGKYLYTPGFARIFDVGDPAKPALVGECRDVGFENGTCILTDVGGKPYLIVCGTDALKVVDVHDPAKPTLVGTLPGDYEGGYYFGRGVRAAGPVIYVLNRQQFNTVDVTDPTRPRRLATLELSGFCSDVQVVGGMAYVAGYYDGLHLVDVRDPANPTPVDHFQQGVYWDDAAWDNIACYQSVDVAGDYVYVTEYYSGLLILHRGPVK